MRDIDISLINEIEYPIINEIRNLLKTGMDFLHNKKYDEAKSSFMEGKKKCFVLKKQAIERNEEYTANISFIYRWFLKLLLDITSFWEFCEDREYQESWISLQSSIDKVKSLEFLQKYPIQLELLQIKKYLIQIEKLYPYVLFLSSELIVGKCICTICKKSIYDLDCTHNVGEVYGGEIALKELKDLGVEYLAMVKNPKDKRCVIHVDLDKSNIEKGPFKLIHWFCEHSDYPLQNFALNETKIKEPREHFDYLKDEDTCPCDKDNKFGECCSKKKYIIHPHFQIKYLDAISIV